MNSNTTAKKSTRAHQYAVDEDRVAMPLPDDTKYPPTQNVQYPTGADLEAGTASHDTKLTTSLTINLRLGFIRKVYSILSVQLLVTVLLCTIATVSYGFQEFQRANIWLLVFAAILSLISMIAVMCFQKFTRHVPYNYITLFVFTLCEAYIVSYVCSYSDPTTVLVAALVTLGITVGLTVYACVTKTDFTYLGGSLAMLLFGLIIFGFCALVVRSEIVTIIYCLIGAFLYGLYLIYDTQLITGGKRYELSIDDYIIGALILYVDIIQIFTYILQLLNRN